LPIADFFSLRDLLPASPMSGTQAPDDDLIERLPDRLIGAMAEDPLGAAVPDPDDAMVSSPPSRLRRRRDCGRCLISKTGCAALRPGRSGAARRSYEAVSQY
jgi:hypothetical protein